MLWLDLLVKLLRFWICWEKTTWHFLKPASSISWCLMKTLFTFLPYLVLFWDCFYCTTPNPSYILRSGYRNLSETVGFVVTWGTLPGENAPSGTLALPGSCCWKHVVGSFRLLAVHSTAWHVKHLTFCCWMIFFMLMFCSLIRVWFGIRSHHFFVLLEDWNKHCCAILTLCLYYRFFPEMGINSAHLVYVR